MNKFQNGSESNVENIEFQLKQFTTDIGYMTTEKKL